MWVWLVVLLSGALISNLSLTLTTPFFPPEFQARNIDQVSSGFVLALSSLTSILTPILLTSTLYSKLGRRNTFICSALVLGLSVACLGILHSIQKAKLFLGYTLFVLLVQNAGFSTLSMASTALLSSHLRHQVSRATTAYMAAQNIGQAFGPLLGGFLFKHLGYVSPFLIFASLTASLGLTKPLLRKNKSASLPANNQVLNFEGKELKYCSIVCNRRALFAFLNLSLTMVISNFFQVILYDQLKLKFSFSEEQASYFYFAFNCAFSVTSLFLPLLPQSCNKRSLMIPSTFAASIGLLFMGPSKLIGFHNSPGTILVGLIITGASSSIPASLCLSEQIEATRYQFAFQYHRLVDLSTSLYVFWGGLGGITGPLLGGALFKAMGFRRVCEVFAIVTLLFSVVQLIDFVMTKESKQMPPLPMLNESDEDIFHNQSQNQITSLLQKHRTPKFPE